MNIKECLDCQGCTRKPAGDPVPCVQKDDMQMIYEDLTWCDTVVFASPVHFAYMTAQLRGVIDRMWAWFNLPGNFSAKRKTVLISTSRGEDYSAILQQYSVYVMLGWQDLGHILGAGKENKAKRLGASIH